MPAHPRRRGSATSSPEDAAIRLDGMPTHPHQACGPTGSGPVNCRAMDRRLARKNIRLALIVGAICMFMFGITFVVAALYVS
jgi:hypothetical protein